ncbi:hypothetical protein OG259_00100 [Streptomyces sp. NBC_00250]|uniref:hypothetical protein n=1 Tax=Streptomyces sp. NBC_00250 TaxID=2903641 RepID=UPI002E2A37C5|nr:hypothetical protein [Streptomyces sp. NBC_00250]
MLYYPRIEPPTELIHQALLYWDGLSTVVPADGNLRQLVIPPVLTDLQARGFYKPQSLDVDLLWSNSPAAQALRADLFELATHRADTPGLNHRDTVLWGTKLAGWLRRELQRLGLAGPQLTAPDNSHYMLVPRAVSQVVIGVVARELAAADSWSSQIPCTDDSYSEDSALRHPGRLSRWPSGWRPAWEVEIGRLLPLPASSTPIADVIAFREKYDDERQRLMRCIHTMLGDLRRDYEHPADVLAHLRAEISEAAEDYHRIVRSTRFAWVQRSIMVTVAVTAAAAGSLLAPEVGWVLGTVNGLALNLGTREIRGAGRFGERKDFSYLHRVGAELA